MSTMKHDTELQALRREIDAIDAELVQLLARRFEITGAVGRYKKQHGLAAVDESREQAQRESIRRLAREAGMCPEFAERFLRCVIDEVVRNH
jgi:chorismate mutase